MNIFNTKNKVTDKHKEAIKKVVDFWVEKSFETPLNQNNGDDSENGALSFMLMNMVSSDAKNGVTNEKIDKFRKSLTESLTKEIERVGHIHFCEVDYHPSTLLADACKDAEISDRCLPCKTWTRIDREGVAKASYQYGGEIVEL